ncbi:MAG: response regulator [Rhodospirillales bacterium]
MDDSPTQILLMKEILSSAGYTHLFETRNPRETLPLHREHHFDLILLDLNMPAFSGFDVLEQFNERVDAEDRPLIVAVSGQADPETQEKAMAMGAQGFIAKPYQITGFLSHIQSFLEPSLT